MKRRLLSVAVILLVAQAALAAPVEQLLPMTIKTTLGAGKTYSFTFSLWDGPNVTANKVWEEGPISLKVKNDRTIKHVLGSDTPFANGVAGAVDFSQQMWVQAGRVWRGASVFHWLAFDQFPHPTFFAGSQEAYYTFANVLVAFLETTDNFDFLAANGLFTLRLRGGGGSGYIDTTFKGWVESLSSWSTVPVATREKLLAFSQ